jgi:hypothetical protein
MKDKDEQREIIRRYILGELTEAASTELAERYFVDEELFDEVLDVENELVDQFVREQLSADERKKFGDYLRRLPDGPSKLATAFALMKAVDAARDVAPVPSSGAARNLAPKARTLWELLFGGRPLLQYAAATILIGFAVALVYLMVVQRHMRGDVENLRGERNQAQQQKGRQEQTAQQEQAVQRERIQQLEQELAEARQQQEQNRTKSESSKTTGTVLASLILTPALRSSDVKPDSLTLTAVARTVTLIAPLPKEERIASYKAVLQTTEGKDVLEQDGLRPQPSNGLRVVRLSLPAARLTSESYKLTLQGKAADGIEIAQDYYFNVVRK